MQPKKTQSGGDSVVWQAPEYSAHHHPIQWYMMLIALTVLLAFFVYMLTSDRFSFVVIGLLGVITAIAASRKPRLMDYQLTATSLSIGEKDYSLKLFKSFTTANEGELDSATLMPLKRFMPPLAIYFMPDDSHEVLDRLVKILPHDERLPDAVDRLARRLRF